MNPQNGDVIAGRYRIVSRIGEGGMGQVFLAEHVHMRRRCAVKFLHPDAASSETALQRFLREAENASRIVHPNVVTMYDFGETGDGGVYLAMEFVEGETLRALIERSGALPLEMIGSIVRQAAAALEAAHGLQIVHRDLKPDNMMVTLRDGRPQVKVVDFGIAKAVGSGQTVTATGVIVGTPDYMSPEQVLGGQMDARSDQYSLALVAVKMLTGRLPFAAATSIESLGSRLNTDPLPLRALRDDIQWPGQLQDVVARALSTEPEHRYPTIAEFARAFERALASVQGSVAATIPEIRLDPDIIPATVVAPRAAPPSRLGRPGARLLLAAGFVAVSLGVGTLVRDFIRADSTAPLHLPLDQENAPTAVNQSGIALQSDTQPVRSTPDTTGTAERAPIGSRTRTTPAAQGVQAVQAVQPDPEPAAPIDPRPVVAVPLDTAASVATGTSIMSADSLRATLAAVGQLMAADAPRVNLEAALARLAEALPRAGQRADSVRVLYARARAHALLEDVPSACRALRQSLTLAQGTSLEETVTRTARQLACP